MIEELPNGKYLARYSVTEGGKRKRPSKTFDLRNDAEWWLDQAKRHGEPDDDPYLRDFLVAWLASKRKIRESTRDQYESHIRLHIVPELGGFRLTKLRRRHVEAWVSDLERTHLSPSTVGKVLTTLRSALATAVPRAIPDNPAADVEAPAIAPTVPRVIGADETARILDAVAGTWVEPISRFLFASALRIGEAVSIDQGDVDFERGIVQIRASKTIIRRLPVEQDGMDAVRLAISQAPRRGRHEPVFFSPRTGDRMLPSSVTHALARITERAGIDPLTAHGLRHAYATVALENDVPLEVIADQLGHRSLTMTRRYAKVTSELREAALARVGSAVRERRAMSS